MAAADPAAVATAAAIAALPKPVLLTVDMTPEALAKCTELAAEALVVHKVEKDQAAHVKRALEAWDGRLWHVVLGLAFGASVAHEVRSIALFRIGRVHVLAFASFDESSLVSSGEKKAVPRAVQKKADDAEEAGDG